MTTVTASSKYQLIIPKKVRENLKIRPGTKFTVLSYDGRIEYIPLKPIKEARGSLPGIDTTIIREPDRL